jgi:hypothetical protein
MPLIVLFVVFLAFPAIAAIAAIAGIVKNPYHNNITKYVASVTKTSQMKLVAHLLSGKYL